MTLSPSMLQEPEISNIDFDPFGSGLIQKVVPATEPQQEVWLSCVIGGEQASLAYNESLALQLHWNLNEEAMMEALKQIVLRHESFRTAFSGDGTKMIIFEYSEPEISYSNISNESKTTQQNIIDSFVKNEAARPFDLTYGPLVRIALFRQSNNSFFLNFNTHHIVCDGWSFGVLFEDLSAIYNALCKNEALPAPPEQFSSYAMESIRFHNTQEYLNTEAYWINKYQPRVPTFEILPDFERPRMRTYASQRDDYFMNQSLADRVKKAGAAHNCSFVTTLLSAFEVLVYKLTGQNDIVMGLPAAGQSATGMYNLIGHCVNLLPLRSTVDAGTRFCDHLKKRKTETLQDYDHQQFTFGSLLKKINIHRDASRIPLVPVCFNIDIGMDMNVSFKDIEHTIIYNPRVSETFELFLNITNVKDGYVLQWSYNTSLYRRETVKGWMDKYVYLLEQISNNPHLDIDAYELEDKLDVQNKIYKRNNTFKPLPEGNTISLFQSTVTKFPQNTAVEFGNTQESYLNVNHQANRLAHFLQQQGLKKGDIVGILLNRGLALPVTLLAILKCGAIYLPLDPDFPENRLKFMLEDSGAKLVIANREYATKFVTAACGIVIEDVEKTLVQMPVGDLDVAIAPNDIAYIIYTSGSTGLPKGVLVTHQNLLNFLVAMKEMFHPGERTRLLAVTTISFDIAGLEIYLPLISGGTVVVAATEITKDGKALLKEIVNRRINLMQATPATFKMMTDVGWEQELPITALCGGEALSLNLATNLLSKVKSLYNMYGPTETTIWSTVALIKATNETVTVGAPIANTQVYIVNDKGELLPDGSIGEICIGGLGVAMGYHNRKELTDEKFITPVFNTPQPGKVYKTGDLGKILPTGEILCLGRTDQQAKIRGFRIELEEIEHELLKRPEIRDAVCAVREDHNGDQKLVAYVITKSEAKDLSKHLLMEWRAKLRINLPHYMIPTDFVKLDEFPLTPNKKIDRKALQKYSTSFTTETNASLEEKSRITQIIRQVWSAELGVPDIEEDDDFFDLGGHSMIAVKAMANIEKETGIKLPIAVLFENPTIRSLAGIVVNNQEFNPQRVVIPIKKTGTKRPIFLVHAGGLNILLYKTLSQYLDEDQPLYGLQGLGLDGDLSHLNTIASIAGRYLSEVLEHEPNGPYIIMGYSFGGIIAYEMARQLIESGKEVQILGMLDTYAKMQSPVGKSEQYSKKILRQLKKAVFFGKSFLQRPIQTLTYQKLVLKRKLDKNFVEPEEEQIYDFGPEVIKAYDNAYDNYVMFPLDIAIDLFRVKERIYYLDDPRFLGWKKYALKGVQIHEIPGDHRTFLKPPNDEKLGKILQNMVNAKTANSHSKV